MFWGSYRVSHLKFTLYLTILSILRTSPKYRGSTFVTDQSLAKIAMCYNNYNNYGEVDCLEDDCTIMVSRTILVRTAMGYVVGYCSGGAQAIATGEALHFLIMTPFRHNIFL